MIHEMERIEIVSFGRLDEAKHRRACMRPKRRIIEQPIAPTNRKRPYGLFRGVVIRSQIGVFQ